MASTEARTSIGHILTADDSHDQSASVKPPSPVAASLTGAAPAMVSENSADIAQDDEDEGNRDGDARQYSALTQTTRRNANGSVSSVFSGNKIRHLKKEDGLPLWRKDIQFEFLEAIFNDDKKVFTRQSDMDPGHTFAEVYVDTLAQSSKTSKILKEKLQQDQASAITMAMVCLLVNVGRMNTTLNFFPEMRAQLRTYHSIPALQAHQDPHAYKQLQDAPRLKSILKGASEDAPQPGTMEEVRAAQRPRTNPVNLIFVLAQYAPKVSELHFFPPIDLFDLIMRHTLSSVSRAQAFLWIMWWYLESDFSEADALNNPFGPGQHGEGSNGMPLKVPNLETLTEEQAAQENVDTKEEKAFGEAKRKERLLIVASEPSPAMTALKRARKAGSVFRVGYVPSDGEADTPGRDVDSPAPHGYQGQSNGSERGSPSPSYGSRNGVYTGPVDPAGVGAVAQETPSRPTATRGKGPGRGNWRRNRLVPIPTHSERPPAPRSQSDMPISPPGNSILPASVLNGSLGPIVATTTAVESQTSGQGSRRLRPLTTHQLAISEYRKSRIRRILERGIKQGQVAARKDRLKEGTVLRSWKHMHALASGWDSEEEETARLASDRKEDEGKNAPEADAEVTFFGKELSRKEVSERPTGGVWMAGFVLPDSKEFEDYGEEFGHMSRVLKLAEVRLQDRPSGRALVQGAFVRRKSVVESYAEDLQRDIDMGDRPRLVRRPMALHKGRTPRESGANGDLDETAAELDAEGDIKAEDNPDDDEIDLGNMSALGPADLEDGDGDGDGDDMDVDDDGHEVGDEDDDEPDLDEEDRELLGEVDAESEDEDVMDQT